LSHTSSVLHLGTGLCLGKHQTQSEKSKQKEPTDRTSYKYWGKRRQREVTELVPTWLRNACCPASENLSCLAEAAVSSASDGQRSACVDTEDSADVVCPPTPVCMATMCAGLASGALRSEDATGSTRSPATPSRSLRAQPSMTRISVSKCISPSTPQCGLVISKDICVVFV
jgi:hypothetical protein